MPGIASTETVDFVTANSDSSECTLYIVETHDWGQHPDVNQLNKKLNSYLTYALDKDPGANRPNVSVCRRAAVPAGRQL